MEKQSAGVLYEKTWHHYLSELKKQPTLRLVTYIHSVHVNYRGFQKWLYSRGYSVSDAKKRLRQLESCPVSREPCSPVSGSIVPVRVDPDPDTGSSLLTGISMTLPDGTVVSVRRGSASAVVSFLKLYSMEGLPCSD